MATHRLFAPTALLADGWAGDVTFEIDEYGRIAGIERRSDPAGAETAGGPVIPGMPNLHSHAFQRAMAGLTERAGPSEDSFWTWRETMYRFVAHLTPERLEAIATQAYIEMLKAGYTSVGEFHYVHNDRDGRAFADPAEMSWQIWSAARTAGIALCHLPVLYAAGGFGGRPAGEAQRRFLLDLDTFLDLIGTLMAAAKGSDEVRVGIAPHSLRAVPPDLLARAVEGLRRLDADAPVHIHIAEQEREVADCLAWSGKRPVDWLFDNASVDRHWCLVHATHMTAAETARLTASGAVAGLCPTTEANLGDGFFPAVAYFGAGGRWGIGSDSHISIDPVEELRWLEYGQRLIHRRRNLLQGTGETSTGVSLWRHAAAGGGTALGFTTGSLEVGARADLLVLDTDASALAGRAGDTLLDGLIFAANSSLIRHVMVGGRWVVRDGRHPREDETHAHFRVAVREIAEETDGT